jgi:ketosteroid isomerase-like protein
LDKSNKSIPIRRKNLEDDIELHFAKSMTPKEFLNLQVEEFNKGNVSFLMTLYENDPCFASKLRQVVKDLEGTHQSLQSFIDMRGKLEAKVKRVLQASDLALIITKWSINGTESDGKPTNLTGRGMVVLRQQSDGTWHIVIENPWGTD